MNIVCDTNVLVSGFLFGGHAREILRLTSRGVVSNFISPGILREVEDALRRPKFGLHPEQVLEIIVLFKDTFEVVSPSIRVRVISSDPKDNHIIEAALAARAEYIISGDRHLLDLTKWEDVHLVTPAQFMQTFIDQQTG